jgi:hypothetical protein
MMRELVSFFLFFLFFFCAGGAALVGPLAEGYEYGYYE